MLLLKFKIIIKRFPDNFWDILFVGVFLCRQTSSVSEYSTSNNFWLHFEILKSQKKSLFYSKTGNSRNEFEKSASLEEE